MKKLIIILLVLSSFNAFSQAQVVKESVVTGEIQLPNGVFPVTPPSGSWATYFRTDGEQYKWDGVTETCISCGGAEVNDLSSVVTWANIPDVNVPITAVTQHEGALAITESQISDLSHTTDTNLTDAEVATAATNEGFVTGAHTVDTNLDQAGVEALGFVTGAHTVLSNATTITPVTGVTTVTQTNVENGIIFHQTSGANTVTVDPMALDYTSNAGWFTFFINSSGSNMTIANGAGVTGASHTVADGEYLTLFSEADDVWQIYSKTTTAGTPEGTAILSTGETVGKVLQTNGDNTSSWVTLGGGGDALVANPLSQFAATTSLQLLGVMSDETGTGSVVFATSPTLVTPTLGVATATTINGATITSGTLNGSVTGTNTGDQSSIVGLTGTKAQFNTELSDGTFLYVGDAPTSHNHTESDITDLSHTVDTNLDIASAAEVDTGTNNTKAISPLALAGSQLQTDVTANNAKVTNATHTGDVTGSTALTIGADKILESHLKAVNTPTDEYILTYEATTGDFEWQAAAGGGDMSTSTYDGAGINEQLVGLTATQTLTNKTLTTPAISGNLTTDGLIDGIDIATDVTANNAKVTDDDEGVAETWGASWNLKTEAPQKHDVHQKFLTNDAAIALNTAKGDFTAGDESKLDAIEALADVTDTANVTTAGALMDSEVDADIKTMTIAASSTISGSNTGDNAVNTLYSGLVTEDKHAVVQLACSDLTTAITTGTSKGYFRMPYAMTVTDVRVSLIDAGTVTGVTIDINEGGTSILSTKLTTDATEETSETATTAAVISDTALADDAKITIDFDAVPTAGLGVIVTIIGTRN